MTRVPTLCLALTVATLLSCGSNANDVGDGGGGGGGDGGGGNGDQAMPGDGNPPGMGPIDLCAGLVQDKMPHPMTALPKPAVGATVVDAEFGTTIRRITAVAMTGADSALRPLYTTIPAWNADETKLMLFDVAAGQHKLYDGKTYQFIANLDISPADLEQVYWDTHDPDLFYYVDQKNFIRYHVSTAMKETLTTFDFCTNGATGGDDPMFTSFDSHRIGLRCDNTGFVYDISTNQVIGKDTIMENPGQVSASGNFTYLDQSGRVTDAMLKDLRVLDIKYPDAHASLGILPTGEDTWNGQTFDPGPMGNDDIGSLVVFFLATGQSKTIIGPKTGWPYPPDGHISAMAIKQPGWMFVSTYGNTNGQGLLDLENLIADTSTGVVCRVGRHRSWGKANTNLATPYWAEAHTTPSPSGTRAVFASDWGNGTTVDTYILELPSYKP